MRSSIVRIDAASAISNINAGQCDLLSLVDYQINAKLQGGYLALITEPKLQLVTPTKYYFFRWAKK
jgi:hypothetical protein